MALRGAREANKYYQSKVPCREKGLDYEIYNYCATCKIKYPKDILKCVDCKYRVRTTGWHRSKVADKKRI